jgi:hypothetical protein
MVINYYYFIELCTQWVEQATYHIRVILVILQERLDLNMVEHSLIISIEGRHMINLIRAVHNMEASFQKFIHMVSYMVNCITLF